MIGGLSARRVLLFWAACVLSAQNSNNTAEYYAQYSASLSAAAGSVTISIPAANPRNVILKSVNVRCSVDCTLDHIREATTSGGSGITPVKRNPNAAWVPATTATVIGGATVTGGTTIVSGQIIPANTLVGLDLSGSDGKPGIVLERDASGVRSYSIRTASLTGNVWISILYEERTNL